MEELLLEVIPTGQVVTVEMEHLIVVVEMVRMVEVVMLLVEEAVDVETL